MKRILTIIVVVLVLFDTPHSALGEEHRETLGGRFNTEILTHGAELDNIIESHQKGIKDSELDNLVKSFVFPPMPADNLNLNENWPGLPLDLINQLKKVVYKGDSYAWIRELNDQSLMITAEDFAFMPNQSEDIDIAEKKLNDAIQSGAKDFYIYQCDTDGDGTDEIIMIQNLEYDYSSSNCAYILKKSGDKYVYAGYDYLNYYRCFALLKHNGKFYLTTNYDDYKTRTTKAVGLFALNGSNSGFMWLLNNQHTFIRKTSKDYQFNVLYKNINAPIVSDVQTYVNETGKDLVYTDRIHKTFYGNEIKRDDLLDKARDDNSELRLWNIHTVDVNNDGKDEFFDRKILYNDSARRETEVNWYNPTTKSIAPAPFAVWSSDQYFLTQQWFVAIGGKTVIFSLYHKNSEDMYLLDARIHENNQTTILLDYMINVETNIELSDDWDYKDTNYVEIEYKDSDAKKAFPEDIDKTTKSLAAKVQGDFVAVNDKCKDIPNSLIVLLEKALYNKNFDKLDLGSASFEINKDNFYNKFGKYLYYDSKKDYDRFMSHIYKYNIDKNTYYLLVADSGGSARLVDIHVYRELAGKLKSVDSWVSLDIDARVIKYQNDFYFIESAYNYYSKYTDIINIYRLAPDKMKDFLAIELKPNQFEWEEVFNNHQSYEKNITSYIESIKDDLMAKSPINDNIQVYLGEEKSKFEQDKQQRLKSVGGDDYDYYKIDFNNDSEPEYFERHFWFPSNYTTLHLINNFYKFTNDRTLSINGGFDREKSKLIQLWFKEIGGKVFTFRLFLNDEYNYFFNVSLVEGTNITQVQSYLIVPKNEFSISRHEHETLN